MWKYSVPVAVAAGGAPRSGAAPGSRGSRRRRRGRRSARAARSGSGGRRSRCGRRRRRRRPCAVVRRACVAAGVERRVHVDQLGDAVGELAHQRRGCRRAGSPLHRRRTGASAVADVPDPDRLAPARGPALDPLAACSWPSPGFVVGARSARTATLGHRRLGRSSGAAGGHRDRAGRSSRPGYSDGPRSASRRQSGGRVRSGLGYVRRSAVIARVEPLTTTRRLAGPFDYALPGRAGRGRLGRADPVRPPEARRRGHRRWPTRPRSPAEKLVAPTAVRPESIPAELVDLALWMADEYCSTPARALHARAAAAGQAAHGAVGGARPAPTASG